MTPIKPPAKHPCGSCPYRRDVPSGIWSQEEYVKLPKYDGETADQPPSVFMCHQQNGCLCAGWTACHDMRENLGLRVVIARGDVTQRALGRILNYTTDTPLFASGAEAAAHGLEDVRLPGRDARKVIDKLERRRGE